MKHKLLQTWARKSAKLLAAIALLATTGFGAKAADELTLEKNDVTIGDTYLLWGSNKISGLQRPGVMGSSDFEGGYLAAYMLATGSSALSVPETLSIADPSNVGYIQFVKSGDKTYIKVVSGSLSGYYLTAGTKNNSLGKTNDITKATDITVTIANDGKAKILFQASTKTNLRYNATASNAARITNYSSSTGSAYLYKKNAPSDPNKPATPEISCADNKVTITCATEGAEIFYTTDGTTTPTAESTKYVASFDIKANTTIKAVAIKDGKSSNEATFVAKYVPIFNSYAEMVAAGVNTIGRVNGPITAIYYKNKNLYTKDSQGNYMDIYGNLPLGLTIENGTTFSYVQGKYIVYEVSGLPELTGYTLGEVSDGTAVEPEVKSVAAGITAADASAYVKYSNVEVTDINDKEFTIKDGDNTIEGYDTFSYSGLAAKTNVDITGFVVMRDKTPRIAPILIEATTETGIAGIEAENGEAVYFNLQGVRVENPENGIFIRVQNGKAVKIMK